MPMNERDKAYLRRNQDLIALEVRNRSEELEKKVESLDLEKRLKIDYLMKMNQLVTNDKAHQALYKKLFKELNELKEDIKASLDYTTRWAKNLENVEEVLRDTINLIPKYEANEFETIEDMFKEVNRLLEKLDVGSARQTERHTDCCNCYHNTCKEEPCNSCHDWSEWKPETEKKEIHSCIHFRKGICTKDKYESCEGKKCDRKASGGEKTVEVGLGDSKDEDSSRKTVSKTSDSLTRFRDKVLEPFDSKPPEHITWQEEKEYLSKFLPSWKIVKREKIEFWRKELLNKTDEVLKSMREVLGIE